MGLFSRFFEVKNKLPDPEIQFGRFSDTYKDEAKYKSWQKAVDLFDNEKFLDSYEYLLDFLKDDQRKNVTFTRKRGKLAFSLFQGSKVIIGEADFRHFMAEARIVRAPQPSLGLMRKVLEKNFDLRYSRYTLDDENNLCLRFDTFVEDGSPQKIYQALKELATEADRKDDVLLTEFSELKPIDFNHTRQLPAKEKKIKYRYFHENALKVIDEIDHGKLNAYVYPGGVSFLILDYLYRVDYLIKPEGKTMETVLECHELFFNDNFLTVHEKNKEITGKIREFTKIEAADFNKELYEVNSTFGLSMPEGHQRFVEIVDAQINDFDWYYQNKYMAYANAICGYMAGYSLYSYALPEPTRALLHLYYMISDNEYFTSLGFGETYLKNGVPDKKAITTAIREIIKSYSDGFSGLIADTKILLYDDLAIFSKSYMVMVRNLNYTED